MKNWMEKNLGRRLISLALALCMVLSVLPPMAYADGDPVDATVDISADDPVDPPVNDPVDPPVNDPVDPPANDPADPPANDPVDPPVNNPVDPPANDPADPPVNDPEDPPANDPEDPPANDPVDPPANDPVDPPVNDPVVDPDASVAPNEGSESEENQGCTCENRCVVADATNSCHLCAESIANCIGKEPAVCTCETRCAQGAGNVDCPVCAQNAGGCTGAQLCEHGLAADCRLCAVKEMLAALPDPSQVEDREALGQQLSQVAQALGLLTEEETASFDLTRYQALAAYLASQPQVVAAWSWIEKDAEAPVLAEEIGAMVVSFATVDNPMYLWSVQNVLPVKLSAVVNGETVELTLTGWSCEDYPTAGGYQGTYIFTTTLPEGYVLGEDAPALEIPVIFLGGVSQMNLEAQTKSNVSYIGQNETTETCQTATVVTSTDEAWSEGWYVVSGEIEIEKITVTSDGPVNLILEKDSSLKVKDLTVNSGAALSIYGQEKDSGTMTILGGMDLLSEEISVVSGAVCAEITLDEAVENSDNIAIPARMSVELNLYGCNISFSNNCGFVLGTGSELALWNEVYGVSFPNGIKANVPLKDIVKDGYAFFDYVSNDFITQIYSTPETKELSGKLRVDSHEHDWEYAQDENDAQHHKAKCTKCLTVQLQEHNTDDLTIQYVDETSHQLVCQCGKVLETVPHELKTSYYSGTQHRVSCDGNCGYVEQFSDHVYDEETGVCACGAEKTSYLGTDGAIHTVGCLDFCVESRLHEGNYFHANYNDQIWYVARGTDTVPGITLLGEPSYNLILADGCDVSVTDSVNCPAMTIWGQENGTGRLTVTDANNTAIYATSSLTINGGTVVASGTKAFSALPAMAQGMMVYVVEGEAETPVLRASAADSFGTAQKMKVTRCNQSHDGFAEADYEYVNESTHRPVCPYCAVSLPGENQPHSFTDGSCACGAVEENGQGVLITTLSGTYSGLTLTGTYLVTGQTTFTDRAEVAGSAKLILADGCTLTAEGGIRVAVDNTLEIVGQAGHTGRLVTTADSQADAPIGGNAEEVSGAITIDGCSVEAEGATDSGIGVSMNSAPGSVTIRNAEVITTELPEGASITDSIIRMSGNATVYGNATLRSTLNVFDEKSLTVPEEASLTVPQNVSVNISGSLQGSGIIYLLSNDFNANTNNSTVRICRLLELEGCTVSGEGDLIAHQGKYFCEAGKEITLTPSEGTQADCWKVSYSVTKEVGDEEWETVVTTNYYPGSFTMPAHPVSVKPHIHTFESGVCKGCGAVDVKYRDENGTEQTPPQCTILTAEMNSPAAGWYLVTGTLEFNEEFWIGGDVKLILADGAVLNANGGITMVDTASKLTVYGQKEGTGVLNISNSFQGTLTATQDVIVRVAENATGTVSGSCVLFKGSLGTVQGTVTRSSVPMEANESLLVPEGSTLTLGSTTFTGPVCLKISDTPTVFDSSLRQRVAATVLTGENAEVFYPLEYKDCTVSGLDETNSFTRSDVTGCLVKVGTTVKLSCQEPLGKLFECFNCGDDLPLNADNSFTMPERKVTVTAEYTDAPLAVQYTDNGVPAYRNFTEADVKAAFDFAMSKERATVLLFQDVDMGDGIELTKGSITLTSSGETRRSYAGEISLKGGNLTIGDVNITKKVWVYSGKLHVTGGYIDDLRVESEDLSDVVLSGGSFGCVYISKYRPVFFVLEDGKALADENNDLVSLNGFYLQSVHVVDHTHSWTYSEPTAKSHVQTCAACSTSVTAPHQAGENDKCGCDLYVVRYVDHRGKDMGEMGCRLVQQDTHNLNNSWYVVKGKTDSIVGMEIRRNVNLILSPNAEVTWNGIRFDNGAKLTIWGQKDGSGKLTVKGEIKGSSYTSGTLELNGGYVYVQNESMDYSGLLCNVVANGGHLQVDGSTGSGNSIGGTFSTDSDGCALVETSVAIVDGPDSTSWSGIIAEYYNDSNIGHTYTVYGNQTLNQPIKGALSIHVPKGASLTCTDKFTSSANIFVDGTFSGSYANTYYGLIYPSDANITVTPEDGKKEFKVGNTSKGTYYKAGAEITLEDFAVGQWLLNNTLLTGSTFSMPDKVSVLERGTKIDYADEKGQPKTTYGKPFPTGVESITLSDNGGAPAWFLLDSTRELSQRLEIEGEVNLVVDAAVGKLIAKQGIHVGPNATLRLYLSTATKAEGFGQVEASISVGSDSNIDNAVIGGNNNEASGSIFFNGPDVKVFATATDGQGIINGAGIGGGRNGNAGPIVVNRGSVSVDIQGSYAVSATGIGGGYAASNTNFTINGGSVTVCMKAAEGSANGIEAAGIGGSYGGENGTTGGALNFLGGSVNVTLTGRSSAAAIGGGAHGSAGTITISGSAKVSSCIDAGSSTAQGAAIGSGYQGKGGSITISGGNVTATMKNGTSGGAAIGNGYDHSDPVDITITGGTVTATLENSTTASGAAIGSGADSTPGKILIAGGTVTAKNESSNSSAAAIGGGNNQNCTFIAIIGGTVTATAPMNAIGGGIFASGSVVSKGGTYIQLTTAVTATSTGTATSTPANGIKYNENGYFEVYGDPVLDASIAIGDVKLLVPEASSLKLGGANNAGTIFVAGTLLDGNGNIYYRINFEENTTKATATADTDGGVVEFQGATYALPGIQVSLSGYDQWYLGDTELTGNTFTMPASAVTIKGHTHNLNYSGRTQNGHDEVCTLNCGYKKESAGHDFTNGECPCGCLQTTYVVPKGDPATVVGLPVPDDGKMTGTSDTNGWYILRGERTLDVILMEVSGNVNLVLEDDATVITNGNMGIKLSESASLTIWGQTGNTGSLNIKEGIEGLGTNSLTINGGKVNVLDIALPIKFPVTVNGGELNMPKQNTAIQSSLTVTGGKAIITCSSGNAIKGNVTVSGGEATVTSTGYLANAIEGNVIVSGGEATVTSNSGNAIEGNVTVSGSGKLTAKSEASKDSERFAIYNANMTDGKVEVKDNGQLTAQSNYDAIYSAYVLLSGGILEAKGGTSGVRATTIDADGGKLIASTEENAAIVVHGAFYVRGATVKATVDSSSFNTYAIHATTMEVTDGNVTAKVTNTNCKGIYTSNGLTVKGGTVNAASEQAPAIYGSIFLEGGKVEAKGYVGIHAYSGTVNVSGGELMAEAAIYASNVNVSGTGKVTAKSGIKGSVNVSGGTVKLSTPEKNGISGQLTITGGWVEANSVQTVIAKRDENGNGNGILITKEIKDLNYSQLSSGLIQLGSDPAKVYGAPVFNQNLTTGENEILKSIHIPENASLAMAQGNTLTNNGHIYLDVGGSLGTAPAAASTGKVYYQVKLGDGVTMQGDRVFVGSSAYAIGSVTFSGGSGLYLVKEGEEYTLGATGWDVKQPITVSGHTHSWVYSGITTEQHTATCQDGEFSHTVTENHAGDPCVCGAGHYSYLRTDNTKVPDQPFCLPVTESTTALTTGWYVALKGELTGKASITVSGDVNLILADEAKYIPSNITLEKGATLTIWGQSVPSLSNNGNNKTGVFSPILVKGEGSLFINGGGVQAAKTSQTESGVAVPMTVNNGVIIAIAYATSGVFTKPITVNSGILEVHGTSVEAPIVADVTVNGGMAGIGCSGHAIQGDLIANGGFVSVSGITGILKNTLQNACAWVNVSTVPNAPNWSGLLSVTDVNDGDYVVYGTPQLQEPIDPGVNIYIPAETKLTTNGKLTTSKTLYVAGTLEGNVILKEYGEIRYAIDTDESTIRHSDDDLKYRDSLFAKADWGIQLGETGKDLGIDGWMINGQFKRYYPNQETFFTMPAHPTTVLRHTHAFDAAGNCTCGLVQVTYWDGTEEKTVLCMPFTKDTTVLQRGFTDGWYAITENFNGTMTVVADDSWDKYNLVLADGCSATITGSIKSSYIFTVWGQKEGTGTLKITASGETPALTEEEGFLTINGGKLELTNNDGTALKGLVYANGGSLTATSQTGSAIQGEVYAYGGSLTATSQTGSAIQGEVYAHGGSLTATSQTGSAIQGDVSVNGSKVTASSDSGYAIDGSVSGARCVLVAKSEKGTAVNGLVSIDSGTATINGKTQAVGENLIVSGGNVTVLSNSADSATVNGMADLKNGNVSIRNLAGGLAIGRHLNTEDAVVYLQGGIGDDSWNDSWKSLICRHPSTIYQAYGSVTLRQGASFPEGTSAIYIPTGTELRANGNLEVSCPIYVSGALVGTNSGTGPIYYSLTLPEGATAETTEEGGTATVDHTLFAKAGATITLAGDYDRWIVNDSWLSDETPDTFTMTGKTTVEGHRHNLVYLGQDQKGHHVSCSSDVCGYQKAGVKHAPDENGHCVCGMILVEYKKPDGTKDSKYCFPFSHETLKKPAELSDEWYVLTENVGSFKYGYYNIKVNGSVNLILADGSYLNLYANLSMDKGSSLTIWGQEQGKQDKGKLFIGYMPAVPDAVTPTDGTPGVGGANEGGKLIINGGLLNVTTRSWDRACIGCDVEINGGVLFLNNMNYTCIAGDVVQNGGELVATGNSSYAALAGNLTVRKGFTTVEGNGVGVSGNVQIKDGNVSIETGSYAVEGALTVKGGTVTAKSSGNVAVVQGNADIRGGTVALVCGDRKSDAISGTLDTGDRSTAVIVCSGNIRTPENGTPDSGLICSGDLSNGKYVYQLYGSIMLENEFKFPNGFYPAAIHIQDDAGLYTMEWNHVTNYLNVSCPIYVSRNGVLVGTNSGSGKVYYQVVKDGADVAAAQGGEITTFGEGTYAYGSVTFSGSTDGYYVSDRGTSTGSLGTYQSGSGYTVTQPITVSAHTHGFNENGDCSCSTHVTVKVTMGQAESYYGSLATALEAIGDQEATITLLDDTEGTITIAGGNLTIQGDKGIESIQVTGGSVEITGGKIGTLNVQGGTVNLSGGSFGTISSSGGVVALLEEDFAFQLEDGSWLDGFNGSDTNTLSGGTVCPVPLKNAQLTGPSSITCGDSGALTFTVTVSNQSTSAPALSWTRDGEALTGTGSSCSLSDWDVSRGADNTVQSYTVTCTASLEGYCLTGKHTITIDPKTLTIEWSDTQFTYDGQAHNPTVSSGVSGISLTLTQAQTNAGSYLAQVTGIQGDKAGNYQLPTAVTQSFTIAPAAITGMTLEKTSVVYNGTAQEPVIKEVKAGELTLSSGDYELSVSPETVQNAGTYQVTVSGKGNFTGSAKTDYSITKAQPTVASDELAITYGTKLSGCDLSGFTASFQGSKLPGSFAFEKPDAMPRVADSDSTEYQLTFTPEDLVNYQTVSMKVKLTVNAKALTVDAAVENKQYDGTNKASYVSGKPVLVGLVDGDAVEFSHGQPYFKSVEVNPSIEILFTEEFAISGEDSSNYTLTQPAVTASIYNSFTAACGTEYTVNADGWQNTDFVVTAKDGFTLSQTNAAGDENWTKNLTVTQEGTGKLGFYVRNAAGAISQLVEEEYWIDKSAPSGTIRFDGTDVTESSPVAVYKNKDVAVTLEGSDALSKVSSVSYLVSDKAMTETELKAAANWTEAKALTITAEDGATKYVYAKVADNAGNVAYLRANYIIFDTTAPSITGVENGKTYYTTQTATITDTNLDSVTLNGSEVAYPIYMPGDSIFTYNIVVTDRAGNSTTITVTMKPISSITDPFKNLTGETVTKDDRKNLEDAANTLKGLIDTTDDEDEKQKLQDGLDMVEGLLKVLDQVKDVESILEALPDSVAPDADDDTVQNIEDARKAVDQLSEHQQSLVDERLKEKLARLENELKDYQFESGADSTWIRGSGMGLQFVANGRLDKLEKVLLNGEALSADDFTKGSPKTTIVLQAVLLESLENGEHTLELVYSNGKVEAGFTVMQGTNYLELTDVSAFDGQTEVEVNGISYPIQELDGKRYVMLPETGDLLTTYTYRNGSNENTHDNYPTGMRVFRINRSASGTTVTELAELADLLQYSGCSIRVTGNRGIRMITSLEQGKKAALTGAGLAGFTLEEYGTVVTWASDLGEGDLNLNSGKHNFAYKRGMADPVFGTSGNLTQYTNVLVDFSLEECSKDIVMRPYIILKDAAGNQHTLYGGHVTRSISYIAWQNRDTYQPGTAAYDYVHELMGNTAAG